MLIMPVKGVRGIGNDNGSSNSDGTWRRLASITIDQFLFLHFGQFNVRPVRMSKEKTNMLHAS